MFVSKISAIMLAAGSSRRMAGYDKLILPYHGKSLLQCAVELLDSFEFHDKILVTTMVRLKQIDLPPTIRAVINLSHETGQSGSLRLSLEMASGEYFLFLLADQPLLSPSCLLKMLELAENNPDKIVFPSINGNPSSPTLFPARFLKDLMSLSGDKGGRAVRAAYPNDCLTYMPKNPEEFLDIDDEADYQLIL